MIKDLLKRKSVLALAFVGLILVGVVYPLGTMNPGFEGVKCNLYGTIFPSASWSGYAGTDSLHKYQDAESYLIQYKRGEYAGTRTETVSWTSLTTPNEAGMGYENSLQPLIGAASVLHKPDLGIQIESNIQLRDINKQGTPDPLNWNATNPLDGRRIEYWGLKATKTSQVNDTVNKQVKVSYQYEVEKQSFLLCPAEFWVGFWLDPSQSEAGTASGWREGEWQNIQVWFMLDFHTWDNAYYDEWLNDPEANVYTTEYGGVITSKDKLTPPDSYRGGFPIAGWIQGWEKAGWTSDVSAGEQQSPTWFKTSDAKTYTAEQLAQLKDILMAKCSFTPSMKGDFISLYDAPESAFSYPLDQTDFSAEGSTNTIQTPDSSMKKTMYFPINIRNFGTYAEDKGWWGMSGWRVYYPAVYFRIRMIYGVYGTFKYLWTEEVTQPWKVVDPITGDVTYPGGLGYPDTFERHGTTVINSKGALDPFASVVGWFESPWNQLWIMFFAVMIGMVLVTVLNPGLWNSLAALAKTKTKTTRSRRR